MPKLANYLHLPVQSSSDRILAAMKRGYTALGKLRKLRAVRQDISISSDFIVGFPGEDRCGFRQDHEADRGRRLRPELQLHLFASPRHAGGRTCKDDVSDAGKHARLDRLQKHINAHALGISQAMVGSVQSVAGPKEPSRRTRTS